jgi:hypothetical protein
MNDRTRRWIAEAAVGFMIALLLIVVAATTVGTAHFVYQGF